MVERIQQTPGLRDDQPLSTPVDPDIPYDRRKLSYATTFKNPTQRRTIQTIEFVTGKLRLRYPLELNRKLVLRLSHSGCQRRCSRNGCYQYFFHLLSPI